MVVEDYPPFLISEIYLQDVGLLCYPHHRPLERVNWVFPFWADARGQDALLDMPLFWGPVDGSANDAYFQTPSAAPQPLRTDCVGKGCNCSCVDCYFHMSVRINPDRRHKSSVNNNPLGFASVFSFLTTSSVSRSSGLLAFYLFGVFALCFLLDFRLFIWRRVLFWSVSFSISLLGPPRLHLFVLFRLVRRGSRV